MAREVDLLIIGGGAAGLTAGLFAGRAKLDTVLLERMGTGGQLINVDRVENYPGFPKGIAGYELGPLLAEQAMDMGLPIEYGEVTRLEAGRAGGRHIVESDADTFYARSIVLACGSSLARLGLPGEEEFEGQGVSYCATCDGEFCRDQPVVVIGGGDSALDEAFYLTSIASSVTLVHRREQFRGAPIALDRLRQAENCTILTGLDPAEISGDGTTRSLTVRSVTDGAVRILETAGVFIYAGLIPNTQFLRGAVEVDAAGHVAVDQRLQTSVPGIFAAGDVRQFSSRQVIAAAGDGATAALWAADYVRASSSR